MISRLKNLITGRTGRNWDLNAVFRNPESIIFPLYHDFSEYVFSPMIVKMKVTQSCLTLCDPMHCIVHGILQARILECVAFPSPGDLPNPRIKLRSPALLTVSLPAEPQGKTKNTSG